MSINYIQQYAGGKVSVEVSDPNDIYKLSTLYANGSEARVVDNTAGLYRLINGAWVYIPASGGMPIPAPEDAGKIPVAVGDGYELQFPRGYFRVNFSLRGWDIVADKTYEEVLEAYNKGLLIVFHDSVYGSGNAIADAGEGIFVAKYLYIEETTPVMNISKIKELSVLSLVISPQGLGGFMAAFPKIPIVSEDDNGKILGVSESEYQLVTLNDGK